MTVSTANNRVTGASTLASGYLYDASGNVISDGNNYYWYDAEGQLCAQQSQRIGGASVIQYIYDPEGARIAKGTLTPGLLAAPTAAGPNPVCPAAAGSNFTLNTRWLVDQSGAQATEFAESGSTETWTHSNVFAGGHLAATWDKVGIHYNLSDPLGTKRVQLNALGQIEETCTSLAFGNDVGNPASVPCTLTALATADDATEHHYTQKERDNESGNDYFFARYYNSPTGRFLSPDWSAKVTPVPYATMSDPQTLNLYAYVGNNPITHIDPDGHMQCDGYWCNPSGAGDQKNADFWQHSQDSTKSAAVADEQKAQQQNAAPGGNSGGQSFSINFGNGYWVSGNFSPLNTTGCSYCIAEEGMYINADSSCSGCQWVQTVDRTGASAVTGLLDNQASSGTPFYPFQDSGKAGSFHDQPGNYMRGDWSKGGGTFSAVSVLGIPDPVNHTFHPVGAISWGYSVSAEGKLTISPPTSTPGRISEAMMFMHQGMPSWSGN